MYGLVDTFTVFFCFHLLGFLISFGGIYKKRLGVGDVGQRSACVCMGFDSKGEGCNMWCSAYLFSHFITEFKFDTRIYRDYFHGIGS